ncbi:MAG: hypothetical protein ACLTVG_18575 [Coprococcus sp.]
MFNLGEAILALLEIVFGFWNNQVSLVFELLGQSPTGFKGGGPWGIIEGIEPLFVGIGSALVVLFFVIGFCAESVDIREEIRFEVLWSSIFVTLMANKIGGLQFGIYRNCQISSRVFHTAVAALPLTKANRSDFE